MPEHYEAVALWVLVPIALFYLGVPLWIRTQQKLAAHPAVRELDMASLEPDIAEYLMAKTRELFELGFDEPTLMEIPAPAPNVTVYLILLVRRPTGDKAMVTAMIGRATETILNLFVAYSTRFGEGRVFDTINTEELSALPPSRQTVRTQTPSVTDTGELYKLHRFILGRHEVRERPMLYEPGRAMEYLTRYAFEREYEELARRGWLFFVPAGDYYLPTLKGAYLMTWGLLQPMKFFRAAAMRRRERRVLAEFRRRESS